MGVRVWIVVVIAVSLPTGGCAGALGQLINPPITSDHLDEPNELNKLKTVSGDRRLVRVTAAGHSTLRGDYYTFRVCAETQADAISARTAKSNLAVREHQGLLDEASEQLTATYARTELSDIVRQLSWQLCNARENGDLRADEYARALLGLQEGALDVLKTRALASGKPEIHTEKSKETTNTTNTTSNTTTTKPTGE